MRAALVALLMVLIPAPAEAATGPGWGLDRIDQRALPLDVTYAPPATGAGVTVYLIDTGLDVNHSEFDGRASLGRNFTNRHVTDCVDEMGVGHGTFVAGIVGGATTGVANQVKLVELQALGCSEGGSTMSLAQERRAVIRSTKWIRRHAVRPAVVNMSLAFDASERIDAAVRRLVRSGIPVVAAAGNEAANACDKSPAHLTGVVTVAASTQRDRAWHGSNQGRCVDIWAPGWSITSVIAGGGVFRYRGVGATSWATPFVTGAVAQFLESHPQASPARVRRWLREEATKGTVTKVRQGTPNRLLFVG